jgi:hypothetical protein
MSDHHTAFMSDHHTAFMGDHHPWHGVTAIALIGNMHDNYYRLRSSAH